jgi:hypothetical protein
MLVRVEQAEVGVEKRSAPYGKMITVSQTEIKTIGGGPNGRFQFITHKMEMPVPHSVHPEVQKESDVWSGKARYARNTQKAMRIQESRN